MKLQAVKPGSDRWLSVFLSECESPAEEIFLTNLVSEFGLAPSNGRLTAGEISVELQADTGPYRFDFLINGWLVIEIDGAEYHSSPEQIRYDEARDRYIESLGRTVVRIPAKVAVGTPGDAISRVRSALVVGPPNTSSQQAASAPPSNIFVAAARGVSVLGTAANTLNETANRSVKISNALAEARAAVGAEKALLRTALETAHRRLEIEAFRNSSSDAAAHFDEGYTEIMSGLTACSVTDRALSSPQGIAFRAPAVDPDPELNAAIQQAYTRLLGERGTYMNEIIQELGKPNSGLSVHFRDALSQMGHFSLWEEVSKAQILAD